MKWTIAIISAAFLSMAVVTAPATFAQSKAATSSASTQQENVSDADLKNFAKASKSIASISQDYTNRLQSTGKNSSTVKSLRQEANEKMVKAVKDNGLTVDQFNRIGEAMQQNPQLLKRLQSE